MWIKTRIARGSQGRRFLRCGAWCSMAWAVAMQGAPLRAQDALPPVASDAQNTQSGGSISVPEEPLTYTPGYYKLGPLDVISILVEGHPEFSDPNILVPSDGRIYLPAAGSMAINGMTIRQVTNLVTRKLSNRLREPRVTVSVRSLRSRASGYVNVVGDAVKPQIVQIRPGWRLTEVLAKVGGVADRLDETKATLSRRGVGQIKVDLFQAASRPLSKANLRLKPNDVLSIMNVEPVTLIGDVEKPAAYRWQTASTLLDAINKAGGLKKTPQDSEAYVVRRGRRIEVKLQDALAFKPGANFRLQPGDVVSVKAVDPISLIGAVEKPDTYSWQRASTVLDAVYSAGGLKQAPRDTRAYIVRHGRKIDVRVEEALDFKNPKDNLALRPGDVLTVEAIPPLHVAVLGAMARTPGYYEVRRGEGVLEAILKAGGTTGPYDQVIATVRRGDAQLPIDLRRLLIANDPEANIKLQEGDTITLAEIDLIRVQVVGRVTAPGVLRIKPNSTLNDALTLAGGLALPRESARISILRKASDGNDIILKINVVALVDARDPSQNTRLRDGDLITVAEEKARTVFLSGEVVKAGAYQIAEGEGVPELLTRVGGVEAAAALSRVIVRRGDKPYSVDVYGALKRGEKGPNFPLQDGDFVVVPKNTARILVMGAVNNPNYFPIPERGSLTLLEALIGAGFTTQNAKVKEVAVIRQPTGAQLKPDTPVKPIVVSLDKLRSGQIGAGNFVLQPNDIVYVPPATAKASLLQQIPSTLGTIGLLRSFGLGF